MKATAEAKGVARLNFIDQISKPRPKRTAYIKTDHADLLPLVRGLVDALPNYGYRRITALLNYRSFLQACLA